MVAWFPIILAVGMVITGTVNTLTTKAADNASAVSLFSHGNPVQFNHPFFQAIGMFIGEFLCLITFYVLYWRAKRNNQAFETAKPFNPLIFWLPAICDMTATSTMYLGLGLTDASIFQMLRGSVVIFTSIFSVVFLKRKLRLHHWVGIFLVMGGTAIVGAQSKICPGSDDGDCPAVLVGTSPANNAMIGNILIIAAQVIVAAQMVIEEKFIGGYNVPALQVVGFEGLFGMCTLTLVITILYNIKSVKLPYSLCTDCCPAVNGTGTGNMGDWQCTYPELCDHFEDPIDALHMMGNSAAISFAVLGNIFSIAFFNYFGVSVTKHINAATRMVLDSLRTMVIWAFSLAVHWETFCWVQIIGFIILIAGTIIFNGLVKIPYSIYETTPVPDTNKLEMARAPLLSSMDDDGLSHSLNAESATITYDHLTNTPTMGRATMMKQK